jgi:hypothetical protein
VQVVLGIRQAYTPLLGISLRHKIEPEVIVEVEVQQGAIHVEQYRVNLVPIEHVPSYGGGASLV